MSARCLAFCLLLAAAPAALAADPVIEATTAAGEPVRLLPNGRWEFVNPERQAQAADVAAKYPENDLVPKAAQGQIFGVGRQLLPGDPDYNRGSLSGKGR